MVDRRLEQFAELEGAVAVGESVEAVDRAGTVTDSAPSDGTIGFPSSSLSSVRSR
ncbi:hypothetical protein [Natronorubrum sp. FCH18a]|uniref:hypothetical protein n=1 Tax=Natronorubrum sp. FCH18a TaxID=3447018 RepID=UPI003F513CB3